MVDLSSSRAARLDREGFCRSGPRGGLGWHRQNDRGTASGCLSRAEASRLKTSPDNVLRNARQLPASEASPAHLQRAEAWRAHRCVFGRCDRHSSLSKLDSAPPSSPAGKTSPKRFARLRQRSPTISSASAFLFPNGIKSSTAWQLDSLEAYANVSRLGRKTTIPKKQQAILWSIFERVRSALSAQGLMTTSELFTKLAAAIVCGKALALRLRYCRRSTGSHRRAPPLLRRLGDGTSKQPLLCGRSRAANIPAACLLAGTRDRYPGTFSQSSRQLPHLPPDPHAIRPVAGRRNVRSRRQSAGSQRHRLCFQRPAPRQFKPSRANKTRSIRQRMDIGTRERRRRASRIRHFRPISAQLPRARAAVEKAGIPFKVLDKNVEPTSTFASISTMHLAKGLEFRAVVVMACDDEVIPLQERIESVGDDADLKEVYDTERHLLYVACTRARDFLLVTGSNPRLNFWTIRAARSRI